MTRKRSSTYAYVPESLGKVIEPSTTNKPQWVTVIMDCGHSLQFRGGAPNIKDEIWCRRHRKMVNVMARYRGEGGYYVKCLNCRYGKSFGDSRIYAEQYMGRHRLKEPRHTIALYNGEGNEIDRWVSALDGQPTLFDDAPNDTDNDPPPF